MLASSCTFGGGGKNGGSIMALGSTSVQPYAEMLAQEYDRLYKKEVRVSGGGSSHGIKSAIAGETDIGTSSSKLKDDVKGQGLWYVEIAKDGLAVVVHENNPVSGLSIEQVKKIYSGEITNWKDVGGDDHKIHLISREEGSGTREAFEKLVMKDIHITNKSMVQPANGSMGYQVSGDKNAIGFISLGLVEKYKVKALMLDGVIPSHDTVEDGSYKLTRPFLFVTKGEPEGAVLDFINFVQSDEGQNLLVSKGLSPGDGKPAKPH